MDREALGASLRRLLEAEHAHETTAGLFTALREVAEACRDIFEVTGSGIMLADDTNVIRYVAASDGQGRLLEQVEAETMQGPCLEAYVHDQVVATDDLRADTRWPAFRAALADEPELRAVLGVPVRVRAVPVGTLDVFCDRPHTWTESEREAISRYGQVVEALLRSALVAQTAGEQVEQLQYALDYRIVIERGVGYLMARDQLDAVSAFNRLRDASRTSRTKIGQVAQDLLDSGRLPAGP